GHFPCYFRYVLWDATIHFALKVLQDLGAAFGPLIGPGYALAIFHPQDVWHGSFVGVCSRFIKDRLIIRISTAPQGLDSQLIHHVLMVVESPGLVGPKHAAF